MQQLTKNRKSRRSKHYLGTALLDGEPISLVQAARLVLEIKELLGEKHCTLNKCREVITLGMKALKSKSKLVNFGMAARECLESKSHRRPRTQSDIRSIIKRLYLANPDLAERPLQELTVDECQRLLAGSFRTTRQQYKARLILSGIFSFSLKKGWCDENPILKIDPPYVDEQEIVALSLRELMPLLRATLDEFEGTCAAGVALMTFAGIRPQEVERLTWADISLEDKCVILNSSHTKTGGSRHVTILPVLEKWLTYYRRQHHPRLTDSICPRGWTKKWRIIRHHAGWGRRKKLWVPDCLRHTYASYHVKFFKDFNVLQVEMGHHSSTLLRTRYLNMKGISQFSANRFWKLSPKKVYSATGGEEETSPVVTASLDMFEDQIQDPCQFDDKDLVVTA